MLTAEPNSSICYILEKRRPPHHHHCIPQVLSLTFYCFFLTFPAFCSFTLAFLSLLVGVFSPALFPHLFWCLPKFPTSSSTHCPMRQKVFCLVGCSRLSHDNLPVPSLHSRGSEMGGSRDSLYCLLYCRRNGLNTPTQCDSRDMRH